MESLTKLDWVGFRTRVNPLDVMDALTPLFGSPEQVTFPHRGGGWMGYAESREIFFKGARMGLMAYGGVTMQGWCQVNLNGTALPLIHGDAAESLEVLVDDLRGQYKRVDIAQDFTDRSVTFETFKAAHDAGGFTTRARKPKAKAIIPDVPTDGRTLYIGVRGSPKFARGYEKGYELAKEYKLDRYMDISDVRIDGVPIGDIFRVELELAPEPHMFPSDILTNRDSYFAGAYPYFADLLKVPAAPLKLTPQRLALATVDAQLAECRRMFGGALRTALLLHDGDFMAVWEKIVGREHSRALVEAGALLVDSADAVAPLSVYH